MKSWSIETPSGTVTRIFTEELIATKEALYFLEGSTEVATFLQWVGVWKNENGVLVNVIGERR